MNPQVKFHGQKQLVEKLLLHCWIRTVKELGHDLVLRETEIDPVWVAQDGDEVRHLHLHSMMRVRVPLRVLDESAVQVSVEVLSALAYLLDHKDVAWMVDEG